MRRPPLPPTPSDATRLLLVQLPPHVFYARPVRAAVEGVLAFGLALPDPERLCALHGNDHGSKLLTAPLQPEYH